MNYTELKEQLSYVPLKIFHEVHKNKDYYFSFIEKNGIDPKLVALLEKNNAFSSKKYKDMVDNDTPEVFTTIEEDHNCLVFFIDILDIKSPKYGEESLFIYKHAMNIISYKLFNSYYDEKTFSQDLKRLLSPNEHFEFLRDGYLSPCGYDIKQGRYEMDEKFEVKSSKSVPNIQKLKKETGIDDVFSLENFKSDNENSFSNSIISHIQEKGKFVSIAIDESKKVIVEKAPVVGKNALVIGKFLGGKLLGKLKDGVQILEEKAKPILDEISEKSNSAINKETPTQEETKEIIPEKKKRVVKKKEVVETIEKVDSKPKYVAKKTVKKIAVKKPK